MLFVRVSVLLLELKGVIVMIGLKIFFWKIWVLGEMLVNMVGVMKFFFLKFLG